MSSPRAPAVGSGGGWGLRGGERGGLGWVGSEGGGGNKVMWGGRRLLRAAMYVVLSWRNAVMHENAGRSVTQGTSDAEHGLTHKVPADVRALAVSCFTITHQNAFRAKTTRTPSIPNTPDIRRETTNTAQTTKCRDFRTRRTRPGAQKQT